MTDTFPDSLTTPLPDYPTPPLIDSPFIFRVIDLKQYVYCTRILFFHTVLPEVRPITYKMEAGREAHIVAEGREKRRDLHTYGVKTGERSYNVPLFAPELGLSGSLDMLIETETEWIPVDYKQSKKVADHYKLQLMAYGRLLEITHPNATKAVKRGFIYLIPTRRATAVPFTPHLRQKLDQAMQELTAVATRQHMPAPTTHPAQCVDCEFRRFCNDV